jgi:hypothetical protein
MRDKGLATAVATLLAAFATAHLMQFGLSAGRAISGAEQTTPMGLATFVAWRGATTADLPAGPDVLPAATHVASNLDQPEARVPPRDAGVPGALGTRRGENGFGLSCDRSLTLLVQPDATLRVRVDAPCDPGVRVVLEHAGLRFAAETGADGGLGTVVPALTPDARIEASFADGTVLSAEAQVPEASDVMRVALAADGWAGLTLHAREAASWRGATSLVHAGSTDGRAGALYRLGDPAIEAPLLAEVYTYPSRRFGALGGVALHVEATLTQANCARDVEALLIRTRDGMQPTPEHLRLSMPGCEAEGDVLVVGLSPPELRVARN